MLKYAWTVLIVFLLNAASAQDKSIQYINGIVVDEKAQPIFGANISISNTDNHTSSDVHGHFKIKAGQGHQHLAIKVSALGYETFEQFVHQEADSLLKIVLKSYSEKIDAVSVSAQVEEQRTAVRSKLNSQQIEESKGKLVAEVFSKLSGVSILNTGHSVSKPVIHGMHSNRVILLNHGVKQESQQWGLEHAPELDPFTADEFEVIKGAQAVRYGADALGGVLIAKSQQIDPNRVSGRVDLIAQSNGKGGTANLQLEGGIKSIEGLAWKAQASGKKLGVIKSPDYFLGNTGSEELNFSGTLQYKKDRNYFEAFYSRFSTELGVFYGAHIGSIEDIYARIENGEPFEKYDFSYKINAPRQQVSHQLGKLKYQYQFKNDFQLDAQYSWQQNHRQEFDMRRALEDNIPMSDMVLTSQQLQLILKAKSHSFGLDAGNQVNNNTAGTGTTPIIPNFDNYSLGIFGIHQFRLNQWILEAGWRYDYRYFDAAGYRYKYTDAQQNGPQQYLLEDNRSFHNFSGSLGVAYPINPKWQYRSSVGLAWRAPTANELYSDGVHHGAGIYEIGNLNLKAEQGLKWVHSISHKSESLELTSDIYGQYIHNYIYAAPNPDSVRQTIRGTFPVFSYSQNKALFYGLDLQLIWKITPKINYALQASLVRAKNISTDSFLPYIPSDRMQNSIQWYYAAEGKGYVKLSHEFVAKQNRYTEGTDYVAPPAAYNLFNVYITHPLNINNNPFNLSLAVDNLFNTSYKDYMDRFRYYAHRPGRNFILSVNYKF